MAVPDAKDVVIEIGNLSWELLDLTYRYEWEDPNWSKSAESDEIRRSRQKTLDSWKIRKAQYLESITRRVKYEALLGRVVARGHIGKVGFKAVYDMDPSEGLDINYEVLSTNPGGEVRVAEETNLRITESEKLSRSE